MHLKYFKLLFESVICFIFFTFSIFSLFSNSLALNNWLGISPNSLYLKIPTLSSISSKFISSWYACSVKTFLANSASLSLAFIPKIKSIQPFKSLLTLLLSKIFFIIIVNSYGLFPQGVYTSFISVVSSPKFNLFKFKNISGK